MSKRIKKIILIISLMLIASFVCFKLYNLQRDDLNYSNVNIDSNIKTNLTQESIEVLFVGDIMTDRYIRKQIQVNTSPDNFVANFLKGMDVENGKYDYVVANLEGPITTNQTKTLDSNGNYTGAMLFTFPTSTIDILKMLNVQIVTLANNHTDNFYRAGYNSTREFLNQADIKFFGNPYNESEQISNILCKKDICIAYIGYNKFTKNNSSDLITNEIKNLKIKKDNGEINFIVVYPHWGEEYEKQARENEINMAHEWIDSGADLVVGSHPHVIQNHEIYKDKHIYYSLGNYIFDQWFSEDVKKGLILKVVFTENDIKIEESNVFISKEGVHY